MKGVLITLAIFAALSVQTALGICNMGDDRPRVVPTRASPDSARLRPPQESPPVRDESERPRLSTAESGLNPEGGE